MAAGEAWPARDASSVSAAAPQRPHHHLRGPHRSPGPWCQRGWGPLPVTQVNTSLAAFLQTYSESWS